jgi:hypothetical protein
MPGVLVTAPLNSFIGNNSDQRLRTIRTAEKDRLRSFWLLAATFLPVLALCLLDGSKHG